jgi:hypothetical protein
VTEAERRRLFAREVAARLRASNAIQKDAAARAHALLVKAQKEIAEILNGAPSDYRRWQLTELQASVERALADLRPRLDGALQSGLGASWEAGTAMVDAPLNAAGLDIATRLNAVDARILVRMEGFLTDRIKDVTADLAKRINGEIASAATGIQTPFEAAASIGEALQSGGMRRANTIVRTQLGSAFSVAAQERQMQAKAMLPGMQKQWRRSGKLHSRYEHDAIDGQIRDVDKPFDLPNGVSMMHPRDPAAPVGEIINCGCTSLPYMSSWEVSRPGRQAFSAEELAASPQKRLIATAFDD